MEINVQQLLLQFLNFGIILFVLTKFLYKPILKILDERANKVSQGIEAAEKSLAEQARLEEKRQAELTKAQKQAAKILDEAHQKASLLGKDIIAEARAEAQKTIKKEQAAFNVRLESQEKKLKKQVASLVMATTKSVLKNSLTGKHQQEIIKAQLSQLKKVKVK